MTSQTEWRIDTFSHSTVQSTEPTHSLHNIERQWNMFRAQGTSSALMAREEGYEWRRVPWLLVNWRVAVDDGNRIMRIGPFLDLEEAKNVLNTFNQMQLQSDDDHGSVWIEAMDRDTRWHEMEYHQLQDSENPIFLDEEHSAHPVEMFTGYALHIAA